MKLAHKKSEVRNAVAEWRSRGLKVGLVPTMGALHKGHMALVRQGLKHCDRLVVSVYVNPTQFGAGEDFGRYPRTLGEDVEFCRKEGVSLVFAPDSDEMYGSGTSREIIEKDSVMTLVHELLHTPDDVVLPQTPDSEALHDSSLELAQPGQAGDSDVSTRDSAPTSQWPQYISFNLHTMTRHLCGATRKGHFEGVLQVVNKLLNIIQPDVAVFGQKDIQQWFVIRQMVLETDQPVQVLMGPTVREPDGLAMSSRNRYLTREQRVRASMLFGTLQRLSGGIIRQSRSKGVQRAVSLGADLALLESEKARLNENGFKVDYLSIVSAPDLQPVSTIFPDRLYVIAVAAWLGETRLIDNILLNTGNSPLS